MTGKLTNKSLTNSVRFLSLLILYYRVTMRP